MCSSRWHEEAQECKWIWLACQALRAESEIHVAVSGSACPHRRICAEHMCSTGLQSSLPLPQMWAMSGTWDHGAGEGLCCSVDGNPPSGRVLLLPCLCLHLLACQAVSSSWCWGSRAWGAGVCHLPAGGWRKKDSRHPCWYSIALHVSTCVSIDKYFISYNSFICSIMFYGFLYAGGCGSSLELQTAVELKSSNVKEGNLMAGRSCLVFEAVHWCGVLLWDCWCLKRCCWKDLETLLKGKNWRSFPGKCLMGMFSFLMLTLWLQLQDVNSLPKCFDSFLHCSEPMHVPCGENCTHHFITCVRAHPKPFLKEVPRKRNMVDDTGLGFLPFATVAPILLTSVFPQPQKSELGPVSKSE